MTPEERIGKLEEAGQRQCLMVCGLLLVVIAVVIGTVVMIVKADSNKTNMTLSELVIRDDHGRDRIRLINGEIGIFDATGQYRMVTQTDEKNNAVTKFMDAQGNERLLTVVTGMGLTMTAFHDQADRKRIVIGVTERGDSTFGFYDTNGMIRINSIAFNNGTAAIIHSGPDQAKRIETLVTAKGEFGTTFSDPPAAPASDVTNQ